MLKTKLKRSDWIQSFNMGWYSVAIINGNEKYNKDYLFCCDRQSYSYKISKNIKCLNNIFKSYIMDLC